MEDGKFIDKVSNEIYNFDIDKMSDKILEGDMMNYVKLGNSNLNVSRICLGCMGFGNASTGQHSWTIKHALDSGINFFDTAIAYQNGTSEEFLGRAIKDFAKRDEVFIATKFLPRSAEEIENGVTGQQHIENYLDKSLSHLGMDYVDLYIYHMWDYQTPIYDILDGLNRAVKAGKVRYIGIANCYAWQLAKANALAEKNNFAKFISVQNHYNLLLTRNGELLRGGQHCNDALQCACKWQTFT